MPVLTESPSTPTATPTLIQQICTDENVMDAINQAISLACTRTLQDYVPGASPLGYVGGRSFLDAVTFVTSALRPYGFYPVDPNNQRQIVNDSRYSVPIRLIPSGAKKVAGGFRGAGKGYMTLYMVENCGQYGLFSDVGEEINDPCFWILHEVEEASRRLKVYIARPSRLLKNGTFLETTEFRTIYDDVLLPVVGASAGSADNAAISEQNDLPQGEVFLVPFTEVNESQSDETH